MSDLSIYLLTFNCALTQIDPRAFARHLFDAHAHDLGPTESSESVPPLLPLPDILVLSLQEIAPLAYAFLGGSFLAPYLAAVVEAVRIVAEEESRGEGHYYTHVVTRNVGMTALMVFAKHPSRISSPMQTAGVGVGLWEMGNKGAVGLRFSVEETELTFVGAHLAPAEDGMLRRNEDWKSIVHGLVFTREEDKSTRDDRGEAVPLLQDVSVNGGSPSGLYSPQSYIFVAGDLNYRTSHVKPGRNDAERFPQPTDEPDSGNHHRKFIESDQLRQQLKQGNTLHGFTEPKIRFPPTYKLLDGHTDNTWNWAQHRWPSWCDRILYHTCSRGGMAGKITVNNYDALPQLNTSDHRPVALSVSIPLKTSSEAAAAAHDDSKIQAPFPIHPDWQSRRAMARRMEIAVGIVAYLGLTWEGNGLLLAMVTGGAGGWLVMRSFLAV